VESDRSFQSTLIYDMILDRSTTAIESDPMEVNSRLLRVPLR